jgi:hypothetical protein
VVVALFYSLLCLSSLFLPSSNQHTHTHTQQQHSTMLRLANIALPLRTTSHRTTICRVASQVIAPQCMVSTSRVLFAAESNTATNTTATTTEAPVAAPRPKIVPSYAQALELFMDSEIDTTGIPLRTAGFDWEVVRTPKQPMYHWQDESIFPDRIIRVEIASPFPDRLRRFAELHMDAWLLLLHQRDEQAPYFDPSRARGHFDDVGQWTTGRSDLQNYRGLPSGNNDLTPLHLKPLTLYRGIDIPARWISAFKSV